MSDFLFCNPCPNLISPAMLKRLLTISTLQNYGALREPVCSAHTYLWYPFRSSVASIAKLAQAFMCACAKEDCITFIQSPQSVPTSLNLKTQVYAYTHALVHPNEHAEMHAHSAYRARLDMSIIRSQVRVQKLKQNHIIIKISCIKARGHTSRHNTCNLTGTRAHTHSC